MSRNPNPDTVEYSLPPPSPGSPESQSASSQVRVDVGALSHPGKVRPNNEDFYLVVRTGRAFQLLLTNLPPGQVPEHHEEKGFGMLVADGMGGMSGGEVAGRLAVTTVVNILLNTPDWIMRAGDAESQRLMRRIARAYQQVDEVLRAEAQANPRLYGMGTTLTLAYSLGADLFLGHVGDSRVYFCRGGELHQLSRDHTYAQALVAAGALRPEEAATSRLRHVLTNALGGTGEHAKVEVQQAQLHDGDQVLLCTDGLTDMVEDAAIGAVLRQAGTAQEACQALVDRALEKGGRDNITVVLARYTFARPEGDTMTP
jgi:protein phosphatase